MTEIDEIASAITRSSYERRVRVLAWAHFALALFAGVLSSLALISAIAFSTSMSGLIGGSAVDALSFSQYLGAGTAFAGLTVAALTAAAGWNLLAQRWHWFGIALEVATMFLFPFGTILAIVTLAVLTRRSVSERCDAVCSTVDVR